MSAKVHDIKKLIPLTSKQQNLTHSLQLLLMRLSLNHEWLKKQKTNNSKPVTLKFPIKFLFLLRKLYTGYLEQLQATFHHQRRAKVSY